MSVESAHSLLLAELSVKLRHSKRLLFITGAGISAESGLPTYRGIGGLYQNLDTPDDLPIEVALSGQFWQTRPELTWQYILQLETACRGARYNHAHQFITSFQEHHDVVVFTQNVDGFHLDAGTQNVIEIHGNLKSLRCVQCAYRTKVVDFSKLSIPPRCPECNHLIRPEVVLFGEMLPTIALQRWQDEWDQGFDMIFSIGTSSLFPYIVEPIVQASFNDIPTIEINPEETDISRLFKYKIAKQAGAALTNLWQQTYGENES